MESNTDGHICSVCLSHSVSPSLSHTNTPFVYRLFVCMSVCATATNMVRMRRFSIIIIAPKQVHGVLISYAQLCSAPLGVYVCWQCDTSNFSSELKNNISHSDIHTSGCHTLYERIKKKREQEMELDLTSWRAPPALSNWFAVHRYIYICVFFFANFIFRLHGI